MKKLTLASLAALAVSGANAAISPYVSEKIAYGNFGITGANIDNGADRGSDESDWAIGSRTAIGAKYENDAIMGAIRAEAEFGFGAKSDFTIKNKADASLTFDAEMSRTEYGVNLYYDLDTKTGFKPYAGVGIGWTRIDYKIKHVAAWGNITGDDAETSFMWSLGAGVSYAALPSLDVDLGYRYANYGEVSGEAVNSTGPTHKFGADISSHEVSIGARYAF